MVRAAPPPSVRLARASHHDVPTHARAAAHVRAHVRAHVIKAAHGKCTLHTGCIQARIFWYIFWCMF
eukprot:IDg17047t1